MTEREKMLAGLLYDAGDPELVQLRLRARRLARQYNQTDEGEAETLGAILRELFPNSGEGFVVQAPVYADYGLNASFGRDCYANFNFTVLDCCPIQVGDNVMFGPNCTLTAPMHPLLPRERAPRRRGDGSTYILEYAKPITIGSSCWLASNVVVCGGVTIGEGCVIGAGSVVTRDIPPHTLAAGNPCRPIRPITEADALAR